MNANPENLFDAVGQLTADALRPFPGSGKVKVKGSRPDIQVGMRFAGRRSLRRALGGANVSQMHYARAQGIAEMQSALEHGMQGKADEFRRHGGEIYEKR